MREAARKAKQLVSGQGASDWSPLLTWLAEKHCGHAGLIVHDFQASAGEVINWSAHTPIPYLRLYEKYASSNSWRNFMWKEKPGFFILGEKINPVDRSKDTPFFKEITQGLNLLRGMGAILWKDKLREPRWSLAIGIVRPESEGSYSEAEQEDFKALIPLMLIVIERHPWIINLKRDSDEELPVLAGHFSTNVHNNHVSLKKDIVEFFQRYAPGSPSEKADVIARLRDLPEPEVAQLASILAGGIAAASQTKWRDRVTPKPRTETATKPAPQARTSENAVPPRPSDALANQADSPRTGRWKDFVPPTDSEIREARRLVSWQSRHKDEPLDPDVLRNARRVVAWADREKKRRQTHAGKTQA